MNLNLDQVSRIYERARVEVLTLLRSREPAQQSVMARREWMSASQLVSASTLRRGFEEAYDG